MSNDPWRPEDVGDAILQRTSKTGPTPDSIEWVNLEDLGVEADEVYAMRQPRNIVLWPMTLHRHGQGCMRA